MKVFYTLAAATIALEAATANPENVERELILGGTEIPIGTKKYVTSIRETPGGDTFCGGVLISSTQVLTTASCTTLGAVNYVAIGTHYSNGTSDGEIIPIVSAHNHTLFNYSSASYDFALLTLANATTCTPAKLPDANGTDVVVGMWAEMMGWGYTAYGNSSNSYNLRGVEVEVWNSTNCSEVFEDFQPVDDTMLCAGGALGKDACINDNGGPLIKINGAKDEDDVVVGLSSWGYGCGFYGVPGVYARVDVAVDWIKSFNETNQTNQTNQSNQVGQATQAA